MKPVLLICLVLYFVPAVITFSRHHHQKVPIALLNLFLGWSVIGWVGALVWASMKSQPVPGGAARVGN